jgi:hypothetical protein|tara:strand:+ start:14 stop:397 length:384 start_codon:yes stop_codon:yes gene_type:complete
MKLWKIALFALIAIASSCSIQKKPQIQITHVLAIDKQGDTLRIPIDLIRPINYRIINYSYGSSWYRPYYNPHQVYYYNNSASSFSSNSKGRGSGNTNNNKNNNKSVPVKTFDKPKVPSGVRNIKIPD